MDKPPSLAHLIDLRDSLSRIIETIAHIGMPQLQSSLEDIRAGLTEAIKNLSYPSSPVKMREALTRLIHSDGALMGNWNQYKGWVTSVANEALNPNPKD